MSKWVKRVLSLLLVYVLVGGVLPMGYANAEDTSFDTVPMINTSGYCTGILKSDGTVWIWGHLQGDGTFWYPSAPVQVQGLKNIISISVGVSHILTLKNDGTIWAWGHNYAGQLGDGTTIDRDMPVQVVELTDIVAIEAYLDYSVALKADGTVWTWGTNHYGELGNNSTTSSNVPVQVLELNDITAISSGGYHNIALKSNNTVWTWGCNTDGELGDGTTTNRKTPVQVQSLTNIVSIAAGGSHSFALDDSGVLWAWGSNEYGQLGDGSRVNQTKPKNVFVFDTTVNIIAGDSHSFALSKSTVWSWGRNASGELGNGFTDTNHLPVRTPTKVEPVNEIIDITSGCYSNSACISKDGTVWVWGQSYSGLLGDEITRSTTPVQVKKYSSDDWFDVWETTLNNDVHTITYYPNGGIGEPAAQQFLASEGVTLSNTRPTHEGYTFDGWHTDRLAASGLYQPGGFYLFSEDKTLYAIWKKNTDPPEINPAKIKYSDDGDDYEADWDETLFSAYPNAKDYPGSQRWKALAIISSLLSCLVYGSNSDSIYDAFDTIGIEKSNRDYFNASSGFLQPGYAFGHKTITRNGIERTLVLAVFRGTETTSFLTDITTDVLQAIGGINAAATVAQLRLDDYLKAHKILPQNAVYLVTGHSLGGGMANCVANTLSDNVDENNVFAFTFASPKTTLQNFWPHDNISNFISDTDLTPKLGPGSPLYTGYHFGRNYYVTTPFSLNPFGACHGKKSYVQGVMDMTGKGFIPGSYGVLSIQCPVDIEVYNSSNILVGKIANNQVVNGTTIPAIVDGDDKYFFLPRDSALYTVKLTATGNGKMDYAVYSIDCETEEIRAQKAWTNVALTIGKTMRSDITDVPGTTLLIIEDGKAIGEIELNGKEMLYNTTFPTTKGIFGTNAKWYGEWWHYLLFFFCFGFIWMWF